MNRDDIRESVFGAAYHDQDPDPQSEREIDELELALVRRALADGYDVIVDATHLDKATVQKWRNFAEALGSAIGPMDFPIPFAEAKRRNSERARSVPESVWKRCLRSWDPTDQSPFGRNKGVGALTHVSKEYPRILLRCQADSRSRSRMLAIDLKSILETVAWVSKRSRTPRRADRNISGEPEYERSRMRVR